VRQSHEAEAAIALEAAAQALVRSAHGEPTLDSVRSRSQADERLDLRPLLARLLDWPAGDDRCDEAAAWFHLALADGLAQWAIAAAQRTRRSIPSASAAAVS
jgi:hydrogenase maturation protein HypF